MSKISPSMLNSLLATTRAFFGCLIYRLQPDPTAKFSLSALQSLAKVDLGRKIYTFLALLMVCVFMRSAHGQVRSDISIPPNGGNQRAEVSQWIGLVKITIAYHSPRVQGGGGPDRKGHIWGEFIP